MKRILIIVLIVASLGLATFFVVNYVNKKNKEKETEGETEKERKVVKDVSEKRPDEMIINSAESQGISVS